MVMNMAPPTHLSGDDTGPAAQPPPAPAEIAPNFPQLEILECLGRGGMGVVYKVRQKSLDRFVALKLLAPERVGDPQFAERFTREAKALAALNHPNIVTIYDFGQAGGFYYLLMEFVDGVNLRQAMKTARFTPEQALAIVPPVCEALQYAHEHGIVHRDIKPENLLLDKTGRVMIADFGVAKMLNAESPDAGFVDSQPAGTPQYMAPEQKDRHRTDHRADIYSLGVVLYELLTGELPADKLQPPSRKVQIDVRLDEIVLRALEAKPELRYQTAGEFRTQVETVVSTPGASGRVGHPATPREQLSMPRASRFTLVLLAGPLLALAVLVGCLFYLAIMRQTPGAPTTFPFNVSPLGVVCALLFLFGTIAFVLAWRGSWRTRSGGMSAARPDAPVSPPFGQPRFSTPAIVGACFAAPLALMMFVVAWLAWQEWAGGPAIVGAILWASLTTTFGWIAVAQIRRSAGKLHGLWLAVFDGLLFPLLALDASIFLPIILLFPKHTEGGMIPVWLILMLGGLGVFTVIVAIAANFLIIRAVWRAVNKPLDGATAKPEPVSPRRNQIVFACLAVQLIILSLLGVRYYNWRWEKTHWHSVPMVWGDHAKSVAGVLRIAEVTRQGRIVIIHIACESGPMPVDFQVSYSGQEIESLPSAEAAPGVTALYAPASVNIPPAYRGLKLVGTRWERRMDKITLQKPGEITLGFVLPDEARAEMAVQQACKLYPSGGNYRSEKLDMLMLFVLQRNVGETNLEQLQAVLHVDFATAPSQPAPAASKTSALAFGPQLGCTMLMNEDGLTPLRDLDYGGPVDDTNRSYTAESLMRLKKPGVAIQHDQQAHKIIYYGMSGTMVQATRHPETLGDQWKNITDMELLALVQSNVMAPGGYQNCEMPDTLPQTIFFKTGGGKPGILQVTEFIDNPRGVKLHYKLVQVGATNAAAVAKPAPATDGPAFGPEIEREISSDLMNMTNWWALNLASGKVLRFDLTHPAEDATNGLWTLDANPPKSGGTWDQSLVAMRAAGVDLVEHPDASIPDSVIALDMRLVSLGPNGWKLRPEDALAQLHENGHLPMNHTESYISGRRAYAFQTREYAEGVLKIEPTSPARLRYKLVQYPKAK